MLLPKYSMPQGQVGRVVKTALPYGSGFCPTAKNKTPSLILAQGFPFTAARVTSNPNLSSSHPGAVRGCLTWSIQQDINSLGSSLSGRRVNLVFQGLRGSLWDRHGC